MDNINSKIKQELKSKYGIDENFYPNINLHYYGGLEKELEPAYEIAKLINVKPDVDFYASYLQSKKEIIEFMKNNHIFSKKIDMVSSDFVGADSITFLSIASVILGTLYYSIVHPYLSNYFGKLGELNAEQKMKEKNELKNNINKIIENKLKKEEEKELIKIMAIEYVNNKFEKITK